mmetsp:Transcript_4202/g.9613  ORF Transcript_4202/g.9613 Transcript_4202/m.9613 type:complete len:772 (-) Transcript_4202:382-2697(-)
MGGLLRRLRGAHHVQPGNHPPLAEHRLLLRREAAVLHTQHARAAHRRLVQQLSDQPLRLPADAAPHVRYGHGCVPQPLPRRAADVRQAAAGHRPLPRQRGPAETHVPAAAAEGRQAPQVHLEPAGRHRGHDRDLQGAPALLLLPGDRVGPARARIQEVACHQGLLLLHLVLHRLSARAHVPRREHTGQLLAREEREGQPVSPAADQLQARFGAGLRGALPAARGVQRLHHPLHRVLPAGDRPRDRGAGRGDLQVEQEGAGLAPPGLLAHSLQLPLQVRAAIPGQRPKVPAHHHLPALHGGDPLPHYRRRGGEDRRLMQRFLRAGGPPVLLLRAAAGGLPAGHLRAGPQLLPALRREGFHAAGGRLVRRAGPELRPRAGRLPQLGHHAHLQPSPVQGQLHHRQHAREERAPVAAQPAGRGGGGAQGRGGGRAHAHARAQAEEHVHILHPGRARLLRLPGGREGAAADLLPAAERHGRRQRDRGHPSAAGDLLQGHEVVLLLPARHAREPPPHQHVRVYAADALYGDAGPAVPDPDGAEGARHLVRVDGQERGVAERLRAGRAVQLQVVEVRRVRGAEGAAGLSAALHHDQLQPRARRDHRARAVRRGLHLLRGPRRAPAVLQAAGRGPARAGGLEALLLAGRHEAAAAALHPPVHDPGAHRQHLRAHRRRHQPAHDLHHAGGRAQLQGRGAQAAAGPRARRGGTGAPRARRPVQGRRAPPAQPARQPQPACAHVRPAHLLLRRDLRHQARKALLAAREPPEPPRGRAQGRHI